MITDMLNGPIILDDHMTRHNYLDFLQNGVPEHGLLSTFSMKEPFLIIPDLWCNISMTFSQIGG
jgi:hypothetical protein